MSRAMMLALTAWLLVACSGGADGTHLERSCRGKAVPNCRPYEASEVLAFSLSPSGLRPGEVTADATFDVTLATCGADSPRPHTVTVRALIDRPGIGDAGSSPSLFTIQSILDDGTNGDEVAKDGRIRVTLPNPFLSDAPANTDLTLRVESRVLPSCVSEVLEVPYRTGARFVPPSGP